MKRNSIALLAAIVALGGLAAHHFAGAGDTVAPAIANAGPATPNFPPAFPPVPATPASPTAAEQAATPEPAPTSAPPPPAPIPAPIAKALAAARAEAPSRPMTRLAKDWFGCNSEDGYNSMLAMIKQKSPGTGDHFHGPDADCAALPAGAHVSVLRQANASGIAQVSLDETHKVYWTDTEALAGEASTVK